MPKIISFGRGPDNRVQGKLDDGTTFSVTWRPNGPRVVSFGSIPEIVIARILSLATTM